MSNRDITKNSKLFFFILSFLLSLKMSGQTAPAVREQELHDGRQLSYREYGDKVGVPVFYFHGFPSSGIEPMLDGCDSLARLLNLRLIAVNRPGYGKSDFQTDRQLLDWPDDISELADSLSLQKFSVLGVSGGCPYALACAYKIPNRLEHVGLVSGLGPYGAPGVNKSAASAIIKSPRFVRKLIMKGFKKMVENNPAKVARKMRKRFPPADQKILDIPKERDVLLNALKEGLSAGPDGAVQDTEIYKNHWGFELRDVQKPVFLWHGEADLSVPVETGKYLADQLPKCKAKYYAGEGHFSLLCNEAEQILSAFEIKNTSE